MSTKFKQHQQKVTYELLARHMSNLLIYGEASTYHASFLVSVPDSKGNPIFGTECPVRMSYTLHKGEEVIEVSVSISGVSSHDPEHGRKRAAAYLRACELADTAASILAVAGDPTLTPKDLWQAVAIEEGIEYQTTTEGKMLFIER